MSGKASGETAVPLLGAADPRRMLACRDIEGIVADRVGALDTVGTSVRIGAALSSPTADDFRRVFVLLTDDDGLRVAVVESFRADCETVAESGTRPEVARRVFARAICASSGFAPESLRSPSSPVDDLGMVFERERSTVLLIQALSSSKGPLELSMRRRVGMSSSCATLASAGAGSSSITTSVRLCSSVRAVGSCSCSCSLGT